MFCPSCGVKSEAEARFCTSCGSQMSTSNNINPSSAQPLEEKVFLSRSGVLVTDAVFKTSAGASYPIRNISSVSVTRKPIGGIAFVLALALTLFGLFVMVGSITVGFVFLLLSVPFWYVSSDRPHRLQLGAGGVMQTAIESHDQGELDGIARAVNDSIIYIQRGS